MKKQTTIIMVRERVPDRAPLSDEEEVLARISCDGDHTIAIAVGDVYTLPLPRFLSASEQIPAPYIQRTFGVSKLHSQQRKERRIELRDLKPVGLTYQELCALLNSRVTGWSPLLGRVEGRLTSLLPPSETAAVMDESCRGFSEMLMDDVDALDDPVVWVDWQTVLPVSPPPRAGREAIQAEAESLYEFPERQEYWCSGYLDALEGRLFPSPTLMSYRYGFSGLSVYVRGYRAGESQGDALSASILRCLRQHDLAFVRDPEEGKEPHLTAQKIAALLKQPRPAVAKALDRLLERPFLVRDQDFFCSRELEALLKLDPHAPQEEAQLLFDLMAVLGSPEKGAEPGSFPK